MGLMHLGSIKPTEHLLILHYKRGIVLSMSNIAETQIIYEVC